MAKFEVCYLLMDNGLFTNGQSITTKEEARMPKSAADRYLQGMERRGLKFVVKTEVVEVSDYLIDGYEYAGYKRIS